MLWLWLKGPKRLWTKPCRDAACREREGQWHSHHLTRLSSLVLR